MCFSKLFETYNVAEREEIRLLLTTDVYKLYLFTYLLTKREHQSDVMQQAVKTSGTEKLNHNKFVL